MTVSAGPAVRTSLGGVLRGPAAGVSSETSTLGGRTGGGKWHCEMRTVGPFFGTFFFKHMVKNDKTIQN